MFTIPFKIGKIRENICVNCDLSTVYGGKKEGRKDLNSM